MSWKTHKLAEIASFKTGKLNSNAAVLGGEFPFFTCAQETFQIDKYAFDTEAVLLAGNNANGVFALKHYNGRFNAYQRTYILETLDPERLNTRFLYFALRPALKRFESESIGATTQYLTKGILDNFKIKVPDLPTQERIAAILSAYDDLIENNRRRIALLEQAARLLYREWFVHFRFPGHETAKFVDGLPEGWEEKAVFDVVDVLSGGTPKTKKADYWDGDIPFFTPKDTGENLFTFETEKMITEEGLKSCNSRLYEKYTLFITARGTVGKLRLAQRPMAMNQSCYALRSKTELSQQFLYFAISDRINHFKGRAAGAVFDAIVVDTFKKIQMVVPTREFAKRFGAIADDILSQIDNLSSQTRQLTRARDLLLPRLMDGRIPV